MNQDHIQRVKIMGKEDNKYDSTIEFVDYHGKVTILDLDIHTSEDDDNASDADYKELTEYLEQYCCDEVEDQKFEKISQSIDPEELEELQFDTNVMDEEDEDGYMEQGSVHSEEEPDYVNDDTINSNNDTDDEDQNSISPETTEEPIPKELVSNLGSY